MPRSAGFSPASELFSSQKTRLANVSSANLGVQDLHARKELILARYRPVEPDWHVSGYRLMLGWYTSHSLSWCKSELLAVSDV